jgi:hypothetical protein
VTIVDVDVDVDVDVIVVVIVIVIGDVTGDDDVGFTTEPSRRRSLRDGLHDQGGATSRRFPSALRRPSGLGLVWSRSQS